MTSALISDRMLPGRPKGTWRRTVETEMKETGYTWNTIERVAQDRSKWRNLVTALCVDIHEEDYMYCKRKGTRQISIFRLPLPGYRTPSDEIFLSGLKYQKLFKMPENAHVMICYGPYESCGLVEHRLCRLQGVLTVLEKNGHTVSFDQVPDRDIVEMYVNGQNVFTCNMRDLDFGSDGELDPLCTDALNAVTNAF